MYILHEKATLAKVAFLYPIKNSILLKGVTPCLFLKERFEKIYRYGKEHG